MTWLRLMLAVLLLAMPASAFAQKFPPLSGRVVDAANLLSPEQEAQLTQLSDDIQKASSRQFVVATIPDLQDYAIDDYGYRLATAWKIGQSEADNGIILIVAPNERAVRIEVGKGLEPIMTDGFSGVIIDDQILPKFRAGDMAGGIMAGAAEIGTQMKLPLEAAEARVKERIDKARASPRRGSSGGVGGLIGIFWVIVVLFFVFGSMFGRGRRGRRYRGSGIGGDIAQIALWSALNSASRGGWGGSGGGSSWGGGGGFGGGGGGFSGGGGSFGGGGASGSW